MNLNSQEIELIRMRDYRARMVFPKSSRSVGKVTRRGVSQTLYDSGERMPGNIPVLYVRKVDK